MTDKMPAGGENKRQRRRRAEQKSRKPASQEANNDLDASAEGIPRRRTLAIDVVWSDIKMAEADVLLVGHYLGVLPQTAELELDRLVSGDDGRAGGKLLITELTRRGALRGDLGEVVLFPAPQERLVALAGMGRPGSFLTAQTRVLARTVGQVIGLLPNHRVLGTVLIGSGKGNLKVKDAATAFIEGLTEALNADGELKIDRLSFVELHLDRALEIQAAVKASSVRLNEQRINEQRKEQAITVLEPSAAIVDGVGGRIPADFGCSMMLASLAKASESSNHSNVSNALATVLAELPENLRNTVRERLQELYGEGAVGEAMALRDIAMKFRLREPENESAAGDIPSRVAFWRSDDAIHAAAITDTATVTERATPRRAPLVEQGHERLQQHAAAITNAATVTKRAIPRRAPLVEQGDERLQQTDTPSFEEDAGSLCRLLIPTELKEVFRRPESLVIEVDRALARVQWEALPAGLDTQPLAVVRSVARQLRTFYSPRPFQVVATPKLKALVIGDPGPSAFVLEAARGEAVEVAKLLRKRGVETTLLVGAPEDGTGAGVLEDVPPADYFEVVSRLLKGEFDIVHYSGHATFDRQYPDRTGWVFKDGVLTAHELEGMERPPRLIFANACLSSQLAPQSAQAQSNAAQPPAVKNPSRGDSALVASLADEFFKQGVADYIGSAWEIPSTPAALFATKFYDALFAQDGGKLGSALLHARKELYEQRTEFGAAWAAYQHYGDPARSISSGPQ
jgi:hypothetical protein